MTQLKIGSRVITRKFEGAEVGMIKYFDKEGIVTSSTAHYAVHGYLWPPSAVEPIKSEHMEIKEGVMLRATDPCYMDGDITQPSLTVGKLYRINSVWSGTFTITNDRGNAGHIFDIQDIGKKYFELATPNNEAPPFQPEYGKEYEFSDDEEFWSTETFVEKNPIECTGKYITVSKLGTVNSFKHCRPIRKGLEDEMREWVIKHDIAHKGYMVDELLSIIANHRTEPSDEEILSVIATVRHFLSTNNY